MISKSEKSSLHMICFVQLSVKCEDIQFTITVYETG